jgi:hypothetical protein
MGGAFRNGCVNEIIDEIREKGYGIVQIKCPEREVWGGVLKPYLWLPLKIKNRFLLRILYPLFIKYTKYKYRKIAKEIIKEMKDYLKSGYQIMGFIGVSASPTCGVTKTLDNSIFINYLLNTDIHEIDRSTFNRVCIEKAIIKDQGLFVSELSRLLRKNNLNIKCYEHDLIAEMKNKKTILKIE